ncbi:unnamed protein product, partial [marine sediment metagenome]
LAALLGMIFGTAGLVIGILNYLRDRINIKATLQWDMAAYGNFSDDPNKLWGVITVTNAGRRTAYISHISLKLPKHSKDYSHLLLREGIAGQKLAEGDPPAYFQINQDGLENYSKYWRKICAEVSVSTGKKVYSKRIKKTPSWAKPPP